MSEEEVPEVDGALRGETGEDATARDWVGAEDPEVPDGAVVEAAPDEAADGSDTGSADVSDEQVPSVGPGSPVGQGSTGPFVAQAPVEQARAEEPPRQVVRATGPPRRPPLLVQGLWPALLAGGLVAATTFGLLPLTVAVVGVQVFLVLGALALLDAPAAGGACLVATGTFLVADAVVLADHGRVSGLAGVAALGLVASLLHQLLRRGRSRVTESLADTLVVIVVSVAAACLLALRQVDGGEEVLLVSLTAAGTVLLAGRIGDRLAPRPMLAIGSTRGWPGLLLGLGVGVASSVLVANADLGEGELPLRSAALLGLVVASTVATADLAADLGAAELRSGWRDARRVAALRPTALLLPYAVLGPVALLAGRLVLA
ncbi:MAG: hypothetical protein LH469_08220 [Frankiaceae bacterium]|nr:hypothetical protein [Frankiaceae bacterium]